MISWLIFTAFTIFLFLHLISLTNGEVTASAPNVEIKLGKIVGTVLKSQHGYDVYAFRGIPYAQPPLGKLRFAPPIPITTSWAKTFEATQDSLICPQEGNPNMMSEDCLKLNVYTRNLKPGSERLPVIVYIHGGANRVGSGHSVYEAGPQYLLDHDVVFVTFNYRLGALGFLSTKSVEAPGNFGYLDQVLALNWVHENIADFGGDPELVTLFGISAGGMAVTLHMASPLSRGLFHRAIVMSGSATNHYSIDNFGWTHKLAHAVGCPRYTPTNLVECLRGVSWQSIIDVCAKWRPYGLPRMEWNYEIDGNFLLVHPTEALLSENSTRIPLLTGITKHEFDFEAFKIENITGLMSDVSQNFDLYAPEFFEYNYTADTTNHMRGMLLKNFYLNSADELRKENLLEFGHIFSDGIIGHSVHRLVNIMMQRQSPVYYYRTDYVGEHSLYVDSEGKPRGTAHGDDSLYLMPGTVRAPPIQLNDRDMFMVERMTKWWTSFAKNGIPTSEDTPVEWLPTTSKVITLYNDKVVHLGEGPYTDRYELWDKLFPIEANVANRMNFTSNLIISLMAVVNIFRI